MSDDKKIFVCLVSKGVSCNIQASRQRMASTILRGRKLPFVEVSILDQTEVFLPLYS